MNDFLRAFVVGIGGTVAVKTFCAVALSRPSTTSAEVAGSAAAVLLACGLLAWDRLAVKRNAKPLAFGRPKARK